MGFDVAVNHSLRVGELERVANLAEVMDVDDAGVVELGQGARLSQTIP